MPFPKYQLFVQSHSGICVLKTAFYCLKKIGFLKLLYPETKYYLILVVWRLGRVRRTSTRSTVLGSAGSSRDQQRRTLTKLTTSALEVLPRRILTKLTTSALEVLPRRILMKLTTSALEDSNKRVIVSTTV